MIGGNFMRNQEMKSDLSKYLDKKSKSSYRFINLHDVKTTKDEPSQPDVVILKEKSQFEIFIDWLIAPFKSKKKPSEEEIEGEDVTEELTDSEDEIVETTDDDEVEMDEVPKQQKWNLWNFLFGSKEDDYEEPEQVPECRDDMRVVALFAKDVLKKIPHEDFLELKESGRLEEFKETLKKYNLIKE